MRPLWTQSTDFPLAGLSLARERGTALAWNVHSSLFLFDRGGQCQARWAAAAPLSAAACSDDGTALALVGQGGEVWSLAPDLTTRWQRSVKARGSAVALDPLGQHVAVADGSGKLHLFDRHGGLVWCVDSPRALRHLAFIPERAALVGCADYGLVACFGPGGECLWREGLVANIGALAVTGDGSTVALACFSEGLCCYALDARKPRRVPDAAPCRLVALSYTGDAILTAGLDNRLRLRDRSGQLRDEMALEGPPAGLVVGPLGTSAVVGLAAGKVIGLEVGPRPG